jgi:hypothetical protein
MIAVQSFLAVLAKACLVIFLFTLVRGLAWVFNLFILAPFLDPLRNIPGPEGSALDTHLGELMECVNMYTMWRLPLTRIFQS